MKPAPFDYLQAEGLEHALELLREYGDGAKVLAGGQSLVPAMNFRLAAPAMLIDINQLSELAFLGETAAGGLRIGALSRHSHLERAPAVATRSPLLAETVPFIAHPQIRNRGTVGGSLAHADPAAELPAVMVALDARFRLARAGSARWVEAKEFFIGLFATVLEPEELLVEVDLPPLAVGTGCSFVELSRRLGDYALVGVAATVTVDGSGRCSGGRLVYMSVGDVPVDVGAGGGLVGETPSPALFEAVAEAAAAELEPAGDIHASAEYRRHLAAVLGRRALAIAAQRAVEAAG